MRKLMMSPLLFRGYLLRNLPLAAFAGLKLVELDETRCAVSVPFGWRSQNPFRSTYFAALSMAAEMSTGAIGLLATRGAPASVAMLIVGLEGQFEKKATGLTTFVCDEGAAIYRAVDETVRTGEPVTVKTTTVGTNPDGTVVARFTFTWSFKRRSSEAKS